MAFTQFVRLPVELQDLVWDHAASLSPCLHFLQKLPDTDWIDWDMHLVPDRHQSSDLNLRNLSLTCQDARSAVIRHIRAIKNRTLLPMPRYGSPPGPMNNLILDLTTDLVCFGGADAGPKETMAAVDWADFEHIVFAGARRFAVRYFRPGWNVWGSSSENDDEGVGFSLEELQAMWRHECMHWTHVGVAGGPGPDGIDVPDGAEEGRRRDLEIQYADSDPPFCARCVSNVMRRFERLEAFWLIVDPDCLDMLSAPTGSRKDRHNKEVVSEERRGTEMPSAAGPTKQPARTFHSYSRTYFSLDDHDVRSELKAPMRALQAIRDNLVRLSPSVFSLVPI
ncbi:hypothetical protein B0T20DRAFT_79927 [Sordaria brevicollis]|uniref:2EXR domain-containing protein n=1 Tax=Sordaria brevicollis TaxID=83679 RepID=A0AAE0U5S8_SORBR|nr:hypothetical protein B0T20DRAFT_79927 [Sordaria brevicollis]